MSDNTEMDRVIAKIQKLLLRTKGDAGTSEAEAQTAMKLAQDLLSKYNLDMAAVEAAQGPGGSVVERVKEEVKGRTRFKWQRELAKYVAEANFCYRLLQYEEKYIDCKDQYGDPSFRRHKTYRHVFVGRKGNVISAQLLFSYLTETIEANVPLTDASKRFSRSAISWREGCADRLCERLAQRRNDLIQEHDVKVKTEAEATRAEALRKHAEEQARQKKQLSPNEEAEVDAAISGIAEGAHDRVGGTAPEPAERPEIDSADDWNPADSVEAPPEETSTAMVLASVYDANEADANYEAAHDLEPGTLARERAEEAARDAEVEAEEETSRVDAPVKEETERQRLARERREEKEHLADRRRWAREDATAERRELREWRKKDHTAYHAGAEQGKHIGLDPQLTAPAAPKQLKGG